MMACVGQARYIVVCTPLPSSGAVKVAPVRSGFQVAFKLSASGLLIETGSSTRDSTPSTPLIQYTRAWIGLLSGTSELPAMPTPAAAIKPALGISPTRLRLTRAASLVVSGKPTDGPTRVHVWS